LKNIGYSSCFKDSVLLTKAECQDTRNFTQKVHLKLYERILNKFDKTSTTETLKNKDRERENENENNQEGGRRQRLPSIGGFKSLHL
jgi:hypothetical protein